LITKKRINKKIVILKKEDCKGKTLTLFEEKVPKMVESSKLFKLHLMA